MKAALIDVDGTLTKQNISFLFGKYLFKQKKISLLQAIVCVGLYFLHICRIFSVSTLHTLIAPFIFTHHNQNTLHEAAKHFFTTLPPSAFHEDIISFVKKLESKQHRIILLSSSPHFLVALIAKRCMFKEFLGTEYIYDHNGKFQRIGHVVTGKKKKNIAQQLRHKGYSSITAISDSFLDKPLLAFADKPIAAYPTFLLRCFSKYKRWKIISS